MIDSARRKQRENLKETFDCISASINSPNENQRTTDDSAGSRLYGVADNARIRCDNQSHRNHLSIMRLADHSSSHQKTIGRETNAPYDCSAPQCVFRIRGSDHLSMSRSTRCGKAITPVVVSSFVGRLNLEVLRSWALDLRFRSIITLIVGISSPHSCHSPLHSGPLFLTPV